MKSSKFLLVIVAMFMLSTTNVEAQNARKKVWDSAKKAWVWVEEKIEKKALERSERGVRLRTIPVPCDWCSGFGKVQVTVPVTVWNPYYQCYQTQYQTQIQYCAKCQGRGWIHQKLY